MNVGETKTIGTATFNGVASTLQAAAKDANTVTLAVFDASGKVVASEDITSAEFAADPTCAAQIAAFNTELTAALTPFLTSVEAFLGKLSFAASGSTLAVVYVAG